MVSQMYEFAHFYRHELGSSIILLAVWQSICSVFLVGYYNLLGSRRLQDEQEINFNFVASTSTDKYTLLIEHSERPQNVFEFTCLFRTLRSCLFFVQLKNRIFVQHAINLGDLVNVFKLEYIFYLTSLLFQILFSKSFVFLFLSN